MTIISDKTYGPRRVLLIQELLSENSFAARTMFCESYRSRSPGRQRCRRGITRQKLPSTPARWPRAGTLTSWMQTDLHEVTFGWRPDRGGIRSVNRLVRVALTRSILVVIRQTVSLEAGREGSLTLPEIMSNCLRLVAGKMPSRHD